MARRMPGEGSIYRRRHDGRWVSYLRLPDGRKKFFYGRTMREVQQRLSEADQSRKRGLLTLSTNQRVADYLERWLEDSVRSSVRPRTYEAYHLNVRRLTPHIGRLKLSALDPGSVQAAYGALLRRGLSRRSVEQAHTVLHRALRQALLWGLIPRNPTEAVSVPRPERREMHPLTEAEVRRLLAASADDHRHHALWVLLVTTGLRVGEALGLTWPDIAFQTGSLSIRRALQRQRGAGLVFVEPKTARSRRTLPLPQGTVQALIEHKARQAKERLHAGELWQDRQLVFCGSTGQPLDPSWLGVIFRRTLESAALPRVRIHDLRHTAATHLLTRGVHPKVVQEMLGHSTITLTLDTYSHVLPAMTRQAANEMASFFESAS